MKQLLLFLVLLGATNSVEATRVANRIYVTSEAEKGNTGKKWKQATTLHEALRSARAGDVIWVKAGIYLTSRNGDRSATFAIPAGVQIYGGFSGKERRLRQRPLGTQSTLSAELGRRHHSADNGYTVVTLLAEDHLSTTIDGFHIVGGSSQSYSDGLEPQNAGGGMYVHANRTTATLHQIRNCTFEDNHAHQGGAVYIKGSRTSFTNCIFVTNDADFYGGAVYNDGQGGSSNPIFQQCSFIDNASNSGGGITNNGHDGEASPQFIGCKFIDNVSFINGAAIFNILRDSGKCEPLIEDCQFIGNESIIGDDIGELGKGADGGASIEEAHKHGSTLRPIVAKRK